jgi:hypothetical protein
MQCYLYNIKRVDTTWGISGDECYISVVFCRYAKHDLHKSFHVELTMGISTTLATD